ncbi:DarT ssDNA thymidine ADP-ribosyltransferase family protein [Lysobacter gummosus]
MSTKPWAIHITRVGCYDENAATRVRAILNGQAHVPAVTVERGWYY